MTENFDQLFREGVTAIRAGDKATARTKLERVVQLEPTHEQAWLWLSAAVDTDEERIVCLQNALTINPKNDAARKGLQKLGGSLEIDTNAAGHSEPPPVFTPTPPVSHRMEHGSAPAVESLFSKASKAAAEHEDDPKPAPRPVTQADESWRKGLYDNVATPAASARRETSAVYFRNRDDEPPPNRNLLDLMDAWVAAIMFKTDAAFGEELRVASLGRWFFGIFVASILASLTQALALMLQLTIGGFTVESFQEALWQPLIEQGSLESGLIPILSGPLLLSLLIGGNFLGSMIGLAINHTMTHIAAGFLGGKASVAETLHAMSIAEVAARIVTLLPIVIGALVPGASALLNLAGWGYSAIMNVLAISYANENFGVFKSILALVFGSILVVVFGCCLGVALIFALSPGGQ